MLHRRSAGAPPPHPRNGHRGGADRAAGGSVQAARREVAALRDLLRCSSDWSWEVGADGRLTHLSPEFQIIAGRCPGEAIGCRFGEVARWVDPAAGDLVDTEAFQVREPFRGAVVEIGDRRQALAGVPLFDDKDGRFIGYRGIGLDVPAEPSTTRELEQSRDELAAANARMDDVNGALAQALVQSEAAAHAKAEFLARMSHELRTPLNAVIGYTEALTSGVLRPDARQFSRIIGDIATSGRQLLRMIEDVLEAATIASGKVDIDVTPVALDGIVANALSTVMSAAAARRLDTSAVNVPAGIDLLVDEAIAARIFANLLRNAVASTPEGGAVGLTAVVSDPSRVEIVIWDTGPGIPEGLREHVFLPFAYGSDDVYVRAADGAGLGLSQARGWAALMGGWVDIRALPQGSSAFVVRLPGARASDGGTGQRSRRVA